MIKILSVLLLLSTLVGPAFSQRKRPVKTTKAVSTTKSDTSKKPVSALALPRTGITVEKYVSTYDIRGDGTADQVLEVQQKCSLETCLGRLASVKYEFNGDTNSMKLLEASIIKANGKKVDLPASTGKVLLTPQAESAPGFSSMKQIEFEFSGLEVGDSARYKLELTTLKPLFGRNFDSIERFALLFDWNAIEINVSAPADYPLQFETDGLQGGPIAAEGGRARWQWKASALTSLEPEAAMLDVVSISPRFAVTSLKSFDQLGGFFATGVREKAIVTPEVQKLADEITADLKTPDEQAAAVYQWVNKNIRYLLIVLDRGGWVPHSTTEILRNGYGDCKDYTTLIHALLKAKGIESVPVLINADFGSWFPKVPVKNYFNHAVLYVPSLKLFADATAPNTRLGIIPSQLVGKTAILASEKSSLIEVPKNNPNDNQISSDIEIEFTENGDLKAVSKNVFSGRSEMLVRPTFGDNSRFMSGDSLVKVLLAFYGINGTGRLLEVSDPHALGEPFSIKIEVTIPDQTTFLAKGSITTPAGLNMNSLTAYEMFIKEEKRRTNLVVGAVLLREKNRLKLPAKVVVGDLPAPVKVINSAGHFSSVYTPVEGGVEFVRELVIAKDSFSPEEYPQFKELIKQAVESLNATVSYTADPTLLKTKFTDRRSNLSANTSKTGFDAMYSAISGDLDQGKLPLAKVRQLEAEVAASPNDSESRIRLLRHYMSYEVRETPAIIKARTAHRIWFVRNRPEAASFTVYGMMGQYDSKESAEYAAIRDEWLKQISAKPSNKAVRLNAVDFVKGAEPKVAEQLLKDGMAVDPNAYEYPFQLSRILNSQIEYPEKDTTETQLAKLKRELMDYGQTALVLVKKERSTERDSDRGELIVNLCRIAVETGDLKLAESLGRELVLDFGGDVSNSAFASAAHIGNIALGTVELSRGNNAKAAEHLLISIRAPQRKPGGYLIEVDFSLAKELFRKGERKAVVEFLKQVLELNGFKEEPELYKVRIGAIKEWLAQAEKGIEPSFDYEKTTVKK